MNGVLPGKGTEAEPYLIEDVYDLCNLSKYNGASSEELSYVKLTTNIDFNNHSKFKYGIGSKELNIDGTNIVFDGNHKEIRNLYMKDRYFWDGVTGETASNKELSAFIFNSIYDTNFVNVVMQNCGGTSSSWIKATNNIHNSYNILALSAKTLIAEIPQNMYECTFNIKTRGTSPRDWGKILITRSRVIIDFVYEGIGGAYEIFIGLHLDTCRIEGIIDASTLIGAPTFAKSTCKFTTSFFNIQLFPGNKPGFPSSDKPSVIGVNVFNSTIMDLGSSNRPSNFKALSEEDCKRTDKLQGLGFPVVGA